MIAIPAGHSGASQPSGGVARRAGWPALLAFATMLAGCHSAEERAEVQSARADQLVAIKAYPAAVVALQRATGLDSNNAQLWLKLGRVELQTGDLIAANEAFQRAVELEPDNVEALQNLALLGVRAGAFDQAKRFMAPLLVLQPDDPAGQLAQGALALHERRFAEALATADHLVTTVPDLSEAYMLRARALAATERQGQAIAGLEKRLVQLPPGEESRVVLRYLLDLYRRSGDLAGVRSTAMRLHALDPADPSFALETARAEHARGRDDRADAVLDGLRRAHPASVAIIRAIADYRRSTLPPLAAQQAVERMAAGASPPIVAAVADALVDLGAGERARLLVAPLARGPVTTDTVDATVALARALASLGRVQDATKLLDRALAFDGTNVPGLIARARLRLAARDAAGALADAQLARSSDGANEEAARLLPQVYAGTGNATLAQQAYALALQDFPDSVVLLDDYLAWLTKAGQRATAIQVVGSFVRQHPGNAHARRQFAALCQAAGDACLLEARSRGAAAGG